MSSPWSPDPTTHAGLSGRVELPPDPPMPPPRPVHPVPPNFPGWSARTVGGTGLGVWTRPVPDEDEALNGWWDAVRQHPVTGLWPVLITDPFWEAVSEPAAEDESAASGQQWLMSRLYDSVSPGWPPPAKELSRGPVPKLYLDDEPWGVAEMIMFTEGLDGLVLVPADAGWQVPGLLGWDGAVNHDLLRRGHDLVLRRWAALFGAQPLGLTRDQLLLHVPQPPRTLDGAMYAALEVAAYCPDAIFQGVDTLEALAPMVAGQVWRFWWD